jgi:ferredoxin
VPVRAHLGLHYDETAALCHWHIPEAHFLESWSDVRAADGTVSIIQPLIAPLYNGYSVHEVAGVLNGPVRRPGYEIVRAYWRGEGVRLPMGEDEVVDEVEAPLAARGAADRGGIRRATGAGGCTTGSSPARRSRRSPRRAGRRGRRAAGAAPGGWRGRRVPPRFDVWDGRFANNGWLQELPKALTTLTWDNAALIAPATADRLALVSGDVVELRQGAATLRIPVWLAPGHAPDTLTLHAGYGRTRAGRVGDRHRRQRHPAADDGGPRHPGGVEVVKTRTTGRLAATQTHWSLEGRNIVRVGTVAQFQRIPGSRAGWRTCRHGESMYPEYRYDGYAWGMAIDQNTCTGCNACVVACQAENNIPVVGKSQVLNHREMHWLRVDRYYTGDWTIPTRTTSRCSASTARRRRARWSAPWRPPCTATKA